jgi:low temperature requirement protein LtrA
MAGFGLGCLIWLGSVFVPPPWRFYLWGLSWLIEFLIPWTIRRKMQVAPIHNIHLPERFGLFVIIVLGESILRVTKAVSAIELWQFFSSVNAIAGFILVVFIWWIYFDYIDRFVTGKLEGTALLYTYLHFFIYLGIVVLAVGVEYSILSHISTLANLANLLIITGVTLFILPLGIIQGVNIQQVPTYHFITSSLILILVMALLFRVEYVLKTFYFLPALTVILFGYLLAQRRMYTRIQKAMEQSSQD